MIIEEDYIECVNEAKEDGFQVLGRVQVYERTYNNYYDEVIYQKGGMPYLLGKAFGSMVILKVARRSGNLADVIAIGQKVIFVRNFNREMDEYVTIDSKYIFKDEDGDLREFYFKKS